MTKAKTPASGKAATKKAGAETPESGSQAPPAAVEATADSASDGSTATPAPARKKRGRRSKGPRFEDSDSGVPVTVRRKRRIVDDDEVVVRKKKKKKRKKRRRRDGIVKPSPPLEKTDPLADYLAGQQVPCPVGCGGFSEIVRVATLESGEGEVWFECLSCAQRRQFVLPKAKKEENAAVARAEEEGREINCPRHGVAVGLRRRGRQFVCPSCGVVFSP